MDTDKYIKLLKQGGAFEAKEISPKSIITAAWPIMKCKYGCPNYGHNRSCPPFAPDYQYTRTLLDTSSAAIIFGVGEMKAGTPLALEVARQMMRDGIYNVIAFGAGPCSRCAHCTPDNCPHPAEVAPSMEACGIDVFATVSAVGLPSNPAPQPGEPIFCYGLLLY